MKNTRQTTFESSNVKTEANARNGGGITIASNRTGYSVFLRSLAQVIDVYISIVVIVAVVMFVSSLVNSCSNSSQGTSESEACFNSEQAELNAIGNTLASLSPDQGRYLNSGMITDGQPRMAPSLAPMPPQEGRGNGRVVFGSSANQQQQSGQAQPTTAQRLKRLFETAEHNTAQDLALAQQQTDARRRSGRAPYGSTTYQQQQQGGPTTTQSLILAAELPKPSDVRRARELQEQARQEAAKKQQEEWDKQLEEWGKQQEERDKHVSVARRAMELREQARQEAAKKQQEERDKQVSAANERADKAEETNDRLKRKLDSSQQLKPQQWDIDRRKQWEIDRKTYEDNTPSFWHIILGLPAVFLLFGLLILVFFLPLLIDTAIYALFGNTLAKWAFDFIIVDQNGCKISSKEYFQRNIAMYSAAWKRKRKEAGIENQRLHSGLETSYDEELGFRFIREQSSPEVALFKIVVLVVLTVLPPLSLFLI